MPETILIDAQAGTFPEGFCPKGPTALQDLYNEIIAQTQFSLSVGTRFFNYGDTEPTADYRVYPWLKTVSGYPDRWYVWSTAAGRWLWPHDIPPGPSGFRAGWVGTEDELKVYDGGETGLPTTLFTGPFWEVDHEFDGRSPMGPGDIPAADPAKTLSPAENYGSGAFLQTSEQVGPHVHPLIPRDQMEDTGPGDIDGITVSGTGPSIGTLSAGQNPYASTQQAMSVIHPVRGLFQIKRTIRKYFRGT